MSELTNALQGVINRASRENASGTPDFILAQYMEACLHAFEVATNQRDNWHGLNEKLSSFKLGKDPIPARPPYPPIEMPPAA